MDNIHSYLNDIQKKYATGVSSEHSFRGHLEKLLTVCCPDTTFLNEPKTENNIRPDFIGFKYQLPMGYIECKNMYPNILDSSQTQAQIQKYFNNGLGRNFILTDYKEFRFYKNDEMIEKIILADINQKNWTYHKNQYQKLNESLYEFSHYQQSVKTASDLSNFMAKKARLIKDVLTTDLRTQKNRDLKDQFEDFKKILIHDITEDEFADIYAQTLTYGLLAARLNNNHSDFDIFTACHQLPITSPFLKKLFRHIATNYDDNKNISWAIKELEVLFKTSDVKTLLSKEYGETTNRPDPLIHFYEDFLKNYDSTIRKKRGVWYTPEPIVHFITRGVDDLLKMDFNIENGLADYGKIENQAIHRVQILDPATGTGTFLAHIVKYIHKQPQFKGGMWNDYVEKHLIPRLHGFEILMASYAIAHLKLDLLFNDTGCKIQNLQRLQIFLTNALEESHPDTTTLFARWLAEEANEANRIKKDNPIMVVLGNPPYSGESQNKGKWIKEQLEVYKKEPDSDNRLQERNSKWLNDDYVKFMRLAEYYIEKNGEGIIGFITGHGYLDNPTFRGMRYHLMKTFDSLYIMDLHGNAKKKEKCPDESKDENIFDIQQGVSIVFALKKKQISHTKKLAHIYHYDLWGTRDEKNKFLLKHDLKTVKWQEITPTAPHYFFVPKDFKPENVTIYHKGFAINELFKIHSVGIATSRDDFVIDSDKENLANRLKEFCDKMQDNTDLRNKFHLKENASWRIETAKQHVFNRENIVPINYRPFDNRYIYLHDDMIERSRKKVMQHFLGHENWGINISRIVSGGYKWNDVFITKTVSEFGLLATRVSNSANCFPLYLYNVKDKLKRKPNLNSEIIEKFVQNIHLKFIPDHLEDIQVLDSNKTTLNPLDILDYIYAILHSPSYRDIFQGFLKIDFPRLPYPNDVRIFWQYVAFGRQIREIHSLENPLVSQNLSLYPIEGDNIVDIPHLRDGKVFINKTQYFEDISEIVWNFYIGGYQPAQKWLKDRKGKKLSFDDKIHYQKIIRALTETYRIMQEIDKVMPLKIISELEKTSLDVQNTRDKETRVIRKSIQ